MSTGTIAFATIHRVGDGLPLVAVNDFNPNQDGLFEAQRSIKRLCKRLEDFPERCTIQSDSYSIYWMSTRTVSFIAVTISPYPQVLTFSFLQNIQKEFLLTYGDKKINFTKRPYAFIDFGATLEKFRHKYNNTRSLATRIENLSHLSQDLKIRPPFQVSEVDIQPTARHYGISEIRNTIRPTVNPNRRLIPVSWLDSLAVLLCVVCAVINLARGMSVINDGHLVTHKASPYTYGATFMTSSILWLLQIYSIFYYTKWRRRLTFVTSAWIIMSLFYTHQLRNLYQMSFHLCSACFTTYIILTRTLQQKLPDYNV